MSAVLGHSLSSPANASEGHTVLLLSSTCTLVYTFRISNLAYCTCSLAPIVDNLIGKLQNVRAILLVVLHGTSTLFSLFNAIIMINAAD